MPAAGGDTHRAGHVLPVRLGEGLAPGGAGRTGKDTTPSPPRPGRGEARRPAAARTSQVRSARPSEARRWCRRARVSFRRSAARRARPCGQKGGPRPGGRSAAPPASTVGYSPPGLIYA